MQAPGEPGAGARTPASSCPTSWEHWVPVTALSGALLAQGHSEKVTTHFPELAGSGGSRLSAWDVNTILLDPIYYLFLFLPLPIFLTMASHASKTSEGYHSSRPRCPLRESVSREDAAVGTHGVSSTTRCPEVGHSSPLNLAICTRHLIFSTGEFGSSSTQA